MDRSDHSRVGLILTIRQKSKLLCLLLFHISCANLSIISNPSDADVLIQNAEGGTGKKLGKTPYNIGMSELESYVRDGPAFVSISKDGFNKKDYIIPYFNFADLSISANLDKSDADGSGQWVLINRLVRIILMAYQSVYQQETDTAKKLIEGLDQKYPGFAAPWIIRALSALQEGKRDEARGFLKRAQVADPDDSNILALMNSLKE
ncbi:MAG: tetratricopeptide repeat protein [Deltaproteobacteria bacterium]|nr:tetratricopeptide repeat protein [Deltaproteobacteria bacterium]